MRRKKLEKKLCFKAEAYQDTTHGVYVEVSVPSTGNSGGFKATLDADDFAKALSKSLRDKKNTFKMTFEDFPPHLLAYQPEFTSYGEIIGFTAFFAMPSVKENFRYKNLFNKKIPWPKLLFKVEAANGHTRQMSVWAYKDTNPGKDTVLYKYPFGNVYPNSRICMGGHGESVNSLTEAHGYVKAFYKMETNDDLYRTDRNKSHMSQLDMFKVLAKEKEFKHEWLVSEGITIGDLIK